MAYTIIPSPDKRFISIKVTGETNCQLALEYHQAANNLGNELDIHTYLIDLTECHNTDTVLRHYNFATHDLPTTGIRPMACIALLVDLFDHSHDFIEVLLRHADIDACIFHDYDLAIQYLIQNSKKGNSVF